MKDKVEVSKELAEHFKAVLEEAVKGQISNPSGVWQRPADPRLLRYYDEITDALRN